MKYITIYGQKSYYHFTNINDVPILLSKIGSDRERFFNIINNKIDWSEKHFFDHYIYAAYYSSEIKNYFNKILKLQIYI